MELTADATDESDDSSLSDRGTEFSNSELPECVS